MPVYFILRLTSYCSCIMKFLFSRSSGEPHDDFKLKISPPPFPLFSLSWVYFNHNVFWYKIYLWVPQIPLYPTAIFQSETDGEGISIVLYFKLNESYTKELPLHFQESIRVSWNLSSWTFLSHCFILLLSANVIFCNAAAGYWSH